MNGVEDKIKDPEAEVDAIFAQMDANHDQKISEEEFKSFAPNLFTATADDDSDWD